MEDNMNLKLYLILIIITLLFTSNSFCQKFDINEFKPEWKHGKLLKSSEAFAQNNLSSILTQLWIPDNWVDVTRMNYHYNDNNLLVQVLMDSSSNGDWKNIM
jgi:hypothetical protein